MTSGKFFNKGVKILDAPDIGHVVRGRPKCQLFIYFKNTAQIPYDCQL
jgi:hypothetical protein